MKKPTLLYVSPFWPKKSGISEYSEALIEGLDKYFDITLVIDDYKIESKEIKEKYNIVKYCSNRNFNNYDNILYNFGNNPEYHSYMYDMITKYPGYIILHDYVLYYLSVGYYNEKNTLFKKIYDMEGINGIQLVKQSLKENKSRNLLDHKGISTLLPLNKEIIEKAQGIFVHSQYSKDMIGQQYSDKKVYIIQLLNSLENRDKTKISDKEYLNKLFNISKDSYIIGSVGFIGPSKLNELTCLAIKDYNRKHDDKIYYVMIGDGDYVNHLLDEYILKTGFLENEEFFKAIISCDLIVNLRYPYNGEASATLVQCMYLGKPCIVTNIGWFSELPNNTVIKLPVDILYDELCKEIEKIKSSDLEIMVNEAKEYIHNFCTPDKISDKIYNFMLSNMT